MQRMLQILNYDCICIIKQIDFDDNPGILMLLKTIIIQLDFVLVLMLCIERKQDLNYNAPYRISIEICSFI